MPEINIDRTDFYEYGKPELQERTRKRLQEIIDCGMTEVGIAQFGFKGIMSGLYIEIVWSYSNEIFKDYMDWAKELIAEKRKKIITVEDVIKSLQEYDKNSPFEIAIHQFNKIHPIAYCQPQKDSYGVFVSPQSGNVVRMSVGLPADGKTFMTTSNRKK